MAKVNSKTNTAFCPMCDARIRFSQRLRLFDVVSCPECDEFFEIVGLSPIVLQWSDEEGFGDAEIDDLDDW